MAFSFLADGRTFTNYGPSCVIDKRISGKMTPHQYRVYLQTNAKKIMHENRTRAAKTFSTNNCD
jgi:hypothetical protein